MTLLERILPACQLTGAHRLAFNLLPLASLHPLPLSKETPSCAYSGRHGKHFTYSAPLQGTSSPADRQGPEAGTGSVPCWRAFENPAMPDSKLPTGFSQGAQWSKTRLPRQEMQVQSLDREDPPGEGNGNPLQYPCLENPIDRGAWRTTVHEAAKSRWAFHDAASQFSSVQSLSRVQLFATPWTAARQSMKPAVLS